jgi:hypothetical protein
MVSKIFKQPIIEVYKPKDTANDNADECEQDKVSHDTKE